MRCALAALLLLLLPTAALADVGPEGEWVATGSPAASIGALGTLLTLHDGTARLIGKAVQRYVPDTGVWQPAGSLLGGGGVPTLLAVAPGQELYSFVLTTPHHESPLCP